MIKAHCKASSPQGFFCLLRQLSIFLKILNLVPCARDKFVKYRVIVKKRRSFGTSFVRFID